MSYLCVLANPATSSFISSELTLRICPDPFAPFVLHLHLSFLGHLYLSIIPHHWISERRIFRMCALEEQSPGNLSNKKTIHDYSESRTNSVQVPRESELCSTSSNLISGTVSLELGLGKKPPKALVARFLNELCLTMPPFLEFEEQLRSLSSCR